jgi:hypothetical protein
MGPITLPAQSVADLDARARQLCGVLLSAPQFLLDGVAGAGGTVAHPVFTTSVCDASLFARVPGVALTCTNDVVTASRAP